MERVGEKKLYHFEKWESAYPLHLQRFMIKLKMAKKMLYLLKEILFLVKLRNFVPFILSKDAKALIKMRELFARFVFLRALCFTAFGVFIITCKLLVVYRAMEWKMENSVESLMGMESMVML